jgi:hypothetical protein
VFAQPFPVLEGDAVDAYRRLESEISGLGAVWPPARPAVQNVLACYEYALHDGNGASSPRAWIAFVEAVEVLRAQTAHLMPRHARRRSTRRALEVLSAIVRENDDLRADRR